MRQGWRKLQVREVLKLEYGKPLPKEDRSANGEFPAYGANGVKCRTDRVYFDRPSIIVGRKGSAGEVTLADGPFWPLDVTYFVTYDDRQHDLKFLYHLLKRLELPKLADGVKPGINRNRVYNLESAFPPLPEQKRIVAILDEAFQGIDRAVANTEKNLANARELTNSVLETAICGNQTTLWRKNNPVSESAAESVARVFNGCRSKKVRGSNPRSAEPANANIFSSLPVDWTLASVEQICTHIVDCLHKTPKWTQSGEICLRTTNFKPGHLDLSSVKYVSKGTYMDRISRLEPKASDVLYSREGGILGIACMFPDGLKACLGQRMMVFRLDQSILIPEYFMAVLNSRAILSEVERLTGGAAAPHLNISDIRKFPIPIPPLSEQAIIVSLIGNLWGKFNRVENCFRVKANALAGLKQSILHKAFAGELTADRVRAQPVLAEAGA